MIPQQSAAPADFIASEMPKNRRLALPIRNARIRVETEGSGWITVSADPTEIYP